MTFHRFAGPALAVLIAAATPGFAQTDEVADPMSAETVVATVNGTPITLGHMIVLRSRLPEQYANAPAEVLFDGILDQLVQQQALAAQAGDLSRTSELVMDNERRALLANEALLSAGRDSVTEAAVQDLYNDTIANAEPLPEFNASHILVETEDEAQAIVEMLEGGADFAETAKEKSTGPSGPNGGQLGWFGLGAMVPEFEKAVAELEDGAISGPVQTQFGWHVLKRNDSRDKPKPALEDVRGSLTEDLRGLAIEAAVEAAVEAADVVLTDKSTLDPAALVDTTLLE